MAVATVAVTAHPIIIGTETACPKLTTSKVAAIGAAIPARWSDRLT
jgi:hypothetical protein